MEKLRTLVWLPNSEDMFNRFNQRVMDGQMDRQTSCDGTVRAIHSIAR